MILKTVNTVTGKAVASRVEEVKTFVDRLAGLLARPPLEPGQGLFIRPCDGVQTWFAQCPIDMFSRLRLDSDGDGPSTDAFQIQPIVRKAVVHMELSDGLAHADGKTVSVHPMDKQSDKLCS